MGNTIALVFVVILAVSVVVMILGRRNGGFGGLRGSADFVEGTLTVLGSGRGEADRDGRFTCTVTGIIVGPEADSVEVYGQLVLGSGATNPYVGEQYPVIYKPGKVASTWRPGTLGA